MVNSLFPLLFLRRGRYFAENMGVFMNVHEDRMNEFVLKLWVQPALSRANVIQKENHILAFIKDNSVQLQEAFARPDFFPGLPWEEALRLMMTILTDLIRGEVIPLFSKVFQRIAISTVIGKFNTDHSMNIERFQNLVKEIMKTKPARDAFYSSLVVIRENFYGRYVPLIVKRRKVIYNECVRRSRLNASTELFPDYISLATLFRPFFWHRFAEGNGGLNYSLSEVSESRNSFEKNFTECKESLVKNIGFVPEEIFRDGVESCLHNGDIPDIPGVARLISIFIARAEDHNPVQTVDKGAETPDKSWFNIHRRNAKYYGFDFNFMDELYQIASEEGW